MSPEERRRRIIAAAEVVFTSKGYAAANMDDVVRACGMSKKTVYKTFATKEQLFGDLVASSLEDAPRLDGKEMDQADGELLLREVMRAMASFILSPRQIALTRLVLAESLSAPELGAIFYETAVVRGQALMGETLRRIAAPAVVDHRGSDELAELLLGAFIGPRFFSSLLGRTSTPTPEEIHARIDWILDTLGPTLGLKTPGLKPRTKKA